MIKFLGNPTITFAEFPDEIALIFNVSNCPCRCEHCSEPELQNDDGIEITNLVLEDFVNHNPGITLIGFLGGDADHARVVELSKFIHSKYPGLKVGMYSGLDCLDPVLLDNLDVYKFGRWIMPIGDQDSWWQSSCGPLTFPFSNQVYLEKINGQ